MAVKAWQNFADAASQSYARQMYRGSGASHAFSPAHRLAAARAWAARFDSEARGDWRRAAADFGLGAERGLKAVLVQMLPTIAVPGQASRRARRRS